MQNILHQTMSLNFATRKLKLIDVMTFVSFAKRWQSFCLEWKIVVLVFVWRWVTLLVRHLAVRGRICIHVRLFVRHSQFVQFHASLGLWCDGPWAQLRIKASFSSSTMNYGLNMCDACQGKTHEMWAKSNTWKFEVSTKMDGGRPEGVIFHFFSVRQCGSRITNRSLFSKHGMGISF